MRWLRNIHAERQRKAAELLDKESEEFSSKIYDEDYVELPSDNDETNMDSIDINGQNIFDSLAQRTCMKQYESSIIISNMQSSKPIDTQPDRSLSKEDLKKLSDPRSGFRFGFVGFRLNQRLRLSNT